ncbi:MAG: 5-(carboxyamino)imidazole ribonucleotide synthase [Nocardia sp.]|nr:5-(carboxyamino)imidazole ribonucleotide synthase [Nocardia sp.]
MPVVAMIGGGQLARMTHQAAVGLGQSLRVLSDRADDPAAQVSPDVVLGSHADLAALREVAVGTHAMTFDHEHVPAEHLRALVREGVNVQPPPEALIYAQDKLAMRGKLAELGVPIPEFAAVESVADVTEFAAAHGPFVLKAVRGGYDGRGVWMVDEVAEAERIAAGQLAHGVTLMAEQRVHLARELSAMVARSPFGQAAVWPVVETVQREGQCAVVIAPAQELSEQACAEAESLALRLAGELGVTGVMAVELFQTREGDLLVNELAMRPHNSGHWGMDGAVTGQFEQHLRAVLDYPLGATTPLAPVTVMANILGAQQAPVMSMDERLHHLLARMPEAKVHLYGKGERPKRKIGHVNILGEDPAEVREKAERAAHWMSHAVWTDGWDPHE